MWHKFSLLIFRYRTLWLILIGLLTIFMAWNGRGLEMSFQMAEVLPHNDSAHINYQTFRAVFGEEANVLVMAVQDKDFFKPDKLEHFRFLEQRIQSLPDIKWTISPLTAIELSKNNETKKFETQSLFPPGDITDSVAQAIAIKTQNLPFYQNFLWQSSTNSYVLLAAMDKKIVYTKQRLEVVKQVQEIIKSHESVSGQIVHISGLPFIRSDSIIHASKEIVLFIILAGIVASIVLFIFFRSFRVIAITLINVGISIIWSSGTLGLLGYKITILTGLIPPLLIVIGIPNAVYMITRYHIEYTKIKNKIRSLTNVVAKTGRSVFISNLTTAIGFGTMILNKSKFLVEFSVVSSINILTLFFISIILIPIFLSFLPNPSLRHIRHLQRPRINFIISIIVNIVEKHRIKVFITAICFFGIALYGLSLMRTSGRITDDVPNHSQSYKDITFFESIFNGVLPFEIMIDTKKDKGAAFTKVKFWKKVNALQDSLANFGVFSRPMSAIELVKYANQTYYNDNSDEYRIPNELDMAKIASYASGVNGNDSLLSGYVDSKQRYVRIHTQMADMGTYEIRKLTDDVMHIAKGVFERDDVDIVLTGASMLIMKSTDYLVKNLFSNLLFAIFVISLIMGTMFKSFKMVFISMVPNLIPLAFTAAIMGFFHVPLKASTSIIFCIALGISVDSAIHYLSKYRQELKRWNGDVKKAVPTALQEIGLSMAYTSIILFLGFSIFIASDFGGTIALGMLISITLFIAMLTNLILLPSLVLTVYRRKLTEKELKNIALEED